MKTIKPMKAASGELPVGDGWVYELKWDGMRAVAFIADDEVRFQTTNLLDCTNSFPELAGLGGAFGSYESLVLDGEIVAFDDEGVPSFGRIQQRMHVSDPAEAARRSHQVPVMYVVFDVLEINGTSTMSLRFSDRRRLLEGIVEPGRAWQLSTLYEDEPEKLLEIVAERGIEGLMAKRIDSTYQPGKRASAWCKVKPRRREEFVVGGWVTGDGNRSNSLGALVIGFHDDSGLRYAGRVGSGFNDSDLRDWMELLGDRARDESPFVDPVDKKPGRQSFFVNPDLVVEVAFAEWSQIGHLRHPSYLGRRFDKDASEVVLER